MTTLTHSKVPERSLVHFVLAHSYFIYFFGLIAGLIVGHYFPYSIGGPFVDTAGIIFLIAGPALILWAQNTSRKTASLRHAHRGSETLCRDHFCVGPYVITRAPTNWGLFIMILGLGLILHSLVIVGMTLLSFMVSRFVFVSRQEAILEARYGSVYTEYKSHVGR